MSRPVALALRALGLGDFLTGIPALLLLRTALPEHRIQLAAPAHFRPMLELVPEVDGLVSSGELEPLTGFDGPVSVAVDLHGKGPESRRLLQALAPGRLVGFADVAAGLSGPTWYAGEHEVSRWCRLIAEAFALGDRAWPSVAGSIARPTVDVPAGLTVIHPGAASPSRRWPADRFADVAKVLIGQGHQVVITGGPSEAGLCGWIADRCGAATMLGLSLTELAGVVAAARLLVCGDTGVAHLASAYRTPSVLLFGPVSPALWGPPADPRHTVLWHGDGSGDPHGGEPDPALLRITAEEVLAAVRHRTRSMHTTQVPAVNRSS